MDGSFAQAAPAVENIANVFDDPRLRLDAALLYLLARNFADARRCLGSLQGPEAEALGLMLALVDGRAAETIPILEPFAAKEHSGLFPLALALAETGKYEQALGVAEDLLRSEPRNALALALAARCTWALGRKRESNAYAKSAARLGQSVERTAMPRRRASTTMTPSSCDI